MTEANLKAAALKSGVSVVICCYNSAEVIVPTIKALSKQEIPQNIGYEVILVDNNCMDNTVELAEQTWNRSANYPLKIVKESEPGLIYARKTGVNATSYDILLFVDDDNILNPDWMTKLYKLYESMQNVGAVGGYNELLFKGDKPAWLDRYKHIYACGARGERSGMITRKLFGAGVSFRTKIIKSILFSDLPLFLVGRTKNVLMRGEDTEMAFRAILMGWKFYYDSSLILKHNILQQRINWNFVCKAVKGGGTANIILMIYRNLIENKDQLSRKQLLMLILRKWGNYFNDHKTCVLRTNREGTEYSFWFYWLYGMSNGFFRYWRTYSYVQKQILNYYSKQSSNLA